MSLPPACQCPVARCLRVGALPVASLRLTRTRRLPVPESPLVRDPGSRLLPDADALDAQKRFTLGNYNSGGGRTEKTRDRVKGLQPGRSENDNRTRARGTKIAAGTTSADGWATLCAKRQVAVIEMRAGQNGGPLPFEAIIELGEPIVNRSVVATEWGLCCGYSRVLKSQGY